MSGNALSRHIRQILKIDNLKCRKKIKCGQAKARGPHAAYLDLEHVTNATVVTDKAVLHVQFSCLPCS